MKIRFLEFSGFKGVDSTTRIDLTSEPDFSVLPQPVRNPIALYKMIFGIVFGYSNWQKELFRGDPRKNKTFTGLLNLVIDGREYLIERDFETNFVACISISGNQMRTLYQGKDIFLNGTHKVYLNTIKQLVPPLLQSINQLFENYFLRQEGQGLPQNPALEFIQHAGESLEEEKDDQKLRLYVPEKQKEIDSLSPEDHPYLYYEIFNKARDAIFLWKLNDDLQPGVCIEANRAACDLTGYSLAELRKKTFLEIKAPEEREKVRKSLQTLVEKGQHYIETVNLTKQGKRVPVGINAHTFLIGGQRVILAVTRDISERKQIEEQLRVSRSKYKMLFDNANDAVLLLDRTRIVECNQSMARLTGLKKEQIIGQEFQDLCESVLTKKEKKDKEGAIKDIFQIVLSGEKRRFECCFLRSDGHSIEVSVNLSPLQLDNKLFIQAIIQDETERRKMEKELLENKKQFQTFIDNSLVGVWRVEFPEPIPVDLPEREIAKKILYEGVVSECNDAFARMYGKKSRKELLGRHPSDFSVDTVKSVERLEKFVRSHFRLEMIETVEKGQEGKNRYFNNSFFGHVENKKLCWLWGLQIDITDRKELEEQFLQSQKMEAIGMLAGGIAHDFNNILTVINGYSDMLSRRMNPDDPLYKYINHIRKAGERASHLTSQLLSFSRRQVFQTRSLDLNKIIQGMISMIQRIIGENIEIVTRLSSNLQPIRFDESKIEQIIMNMVVNARDAMPGGGKLFIETRNVHLDEEYCTLHPEVQPGDYVQVAITDTGIGISEEVIEHIFEPFFTTKEKGMGTGLGLATVYGIVKQANGHITVRSQEGQGTTFFIYFPQSSDEVPEVIEDDRLVLINDLRGEETILVVEDDETVRQVMVEALHNYGYKVLEAMDGNEALEIFALSADQIDLIISDVVMPRLDGKKFHKQILKSNPQIRFIFMSGYIDNKLLEFDDLQNIEFIQKPFKLNELIKKVRAVLDKEKLNLN